jgi:hypothetical protein
MKYQVICIEEDANLILGNIYTAEKSDITSVNITGVFKNSYNPEEDETRRFAKDLCQKSFIYVKDKEERLYPKMVSSGVYELYLKYKDKPIGTKTYAEAGAPGVGCCKSVITRITDECIYGVEYFNDMFVPDGDYYM